VECGVDCGIERAVVARVSLGSLTETRYARGSEMRAGPASRVGSVTEEGKAPTSSVSAIDTSVTDIGEAALVRASSIEISRGSVLAGRYQIEAVIGKGGSGIVLRAFDRVAQVPVAVKILKPDLASDPRWIERFSRELRLARQIQHPNVCRVFDIGQADGHWFITMELATGGTLRDQLGENAASRSIEAKVADVRAIVAGLAAIHEAGIVHRDLKPDNFLRMADGRLVLSDFGLATNPADAPTVSILVGTPHYMAPEVVMGEAADQRSDVWAAAIVIHEILLGTRPARAAMTVPATVRIPADAHGSTRALLGVCKAALVDEPDYRPDDGRSLAALTETAIASRHRFQLPRRSRLQNARWGLTIVATLSLSVFLGKRLWQPVHATALREAPDRDIKITGKPRDWSPGSMAFATFDQRVHCFALLPGGETARVVWGEPRRAEDIDIASGRRAPTALPSETYETDCPQLSPTGTSLLFTRLSTGTAPEIMLGKPDGGDATVLTSGSEPRWLPHGDEFLFNVNTGYVGLFSVPTMASTLFSDNRGQVTRYIYKKTVSSSGNTVAISYHGDELYRLLEVHSLPDMNLVASWRVPLSIRGVAFNGEVLTLSDVDTPGTLDILDWRTGAAHRSGFLPSSAVESIFDAPGESKVILSSAKDSDVWLFDDANNSRRLTHDGRNYGASWSPTGDVLVSHRFENGQFAIFRYDVNGRSKQITNGPFDATPSFSRDGSAWVYSDYPRKTIMLCEGDSCRPARVERERLPGWPTISPDRQHIAYVDQGGSKHLNVVNTDGSSKRDLGPTAIQCAPVWTSATALWAYSGPGRNRKWEEIDIASGMKTGRWRSATTLDLDVADCNVGAESPGSPFFQHARTISKETWTAQSIPRIELN